MSDEKPQRDPEHDASGDDENHADAAGEPEASSAQADATSASADVSSPKVDVAGPHTETAVPRWAQARWLRVARLFLAPVLAAGAVGMHFWLNVPEGGVHVSSRDQGARSRRAKNKKRPRVTRFEPRSDAELARLQQRYHTVDFESEPIVSRWARRQQALVNKAVVVARKQAFEGAPEDPRVIVTGTKCRTIRCRFLLRSPYAHEVGLLDRALRRLEVDGESLWREYASKTVPPPEGAPPDDMYLQVTVVFVADDLSGRNIEAVPLQPEEEDAADSPGADE